MSLLWIDGHLVDKADAKVSPFDHGFLYGDGVWEHLRAFNGKLFRPHEHYRLLSTAAHNIGIAIPLSRDELVAVIEATLKANDRTDGYVRVIVTRGPGTIGPDPRKLDPQVIVIAEEYQPFPPELYGHGLHAVVSEPGIWSIGRPPFFRLLAQGHMIKAKTDALARGCLEAVLVDDCHRVYGCTEGNLFRVLDGVVRPVTHFPYEVAQQVVREVTGPLGIPVAATRDERDVAPTPDHLLDAEEVFLAGTTCGVIGIVRLDGRDIGTGTEGPVTKQVRERYQTLVRGG